MNTECKTMKVVAFPYDMELDSYLRNRQVLKNIDISFLGRPKGWRKKEYNSQLPIINDVEEVFDEVDAIWIVNSYQKLDFRDYIFPVIKAAVDRGKKIILSRSLSKEEQKLLENISLEEFVNFQQKEYSNYLKEDVEKIYEIDVPVIIVTGITENTKKMDLQFKLYNQIKEREYFPYLLTSRHWNLAFKDDNIEEMPRFMFDEKISYKEKIISLNHYIKAIEKLKEPDLFIIGVPGEAINYSNRIIQNLVEVSREIVTAVTPDVSILGTTYQKFDINKLNKIIDDVERFLGMTIDYCYVVNRMINMDKAIEDDCLDFLFLDENYVRKRVLEMETDRVFYLEDSNECEELVNNIFDMLTSSTKRVY